MRAVQFDHYGDVDVLEVREVAEPEAAPGRVVVEVAVTALNPGEIAVREGAFESVFPATFPSGQGSDFAGRVRTIGEGVHGWHEGDEVFGWTDERAAQADHVSVPADQLTIAPPGVAAEQGASLHVAGCTAYGLVETLAPQAGEAVLVTAAAGGVGCAVVQLLRRRDVRVLAVAGEGNAEYLRSLGAEFVRHGDGLGHRLRDDVAPDGIDAVADCFGDGYVELAVGLGVPATRVATIIDFERAQRLGTHVVMGSDWSSAGVLTELAQLVGDGELTWPIAAEYPLEQVREAYTELARRRTRGKIVLRVR